MVRLHWPVGLLGALLLAVGANATVSLHGTTAARFAWTPSSGPVQGYFVYVSRNGSAYPSKPNQFVMEPTATISGSFGDTLAIRVAAFDRDGKRGPLSAPSTPVRFVAPRSGGSDSGEPSDGSGTTKGLAEGAFVAATSATDGGETELWSVNQDGSQLVGGAVGTWKATARGDFNGDGIGDVFWRKQDTGETALWLMDEAGVGPTPLLRRVPDTAWRVVGTGDFDGDGISEVLWRNRRTGHNAVWFMEGADLVVRPLLRRLRAAAWRVAGTGDFDGDGISEVLWRNRNTGHNALWFMDAAEVVSTPLIRRVPDTAWRVAGTGDFDGDGISDIVWRNPKTGHTALWFMEDGAPVATPLLHEGSIHWEVVSTEDIDSDGHSDILWSEPGSGVVRAWLMRGTEKREERVLGSFWNDAPLVGVPDS